MLVCFDTEEAVTYGDVEAVILNRFRYLIRDSKEHGKYQQDGRTWCFASAAALHRLWPMWSEHKIRRALNRLVDAEVLLRDHLAENKYDRTYYYAFNDEPSMLHQCKMDVTRASDGSDEGVRYSNKGNNKGNNVKETPDADAPDPPSRSLPDWCREYADAFWNHLAAHNLLLKAHRDKGQPAVVEDWADVFDKVERLDGHSRETIQAVCAWLFRPGNWWIETGNLRTAAKLRQKDRDGETYFNRFNHERQHPPKRHGRQQEIDWADEYRKAHGTY